MQFLRSFLGRHLAGKPEVTSRNAGCFLRLLRTQATQVCLPFRRSLELPPAWIMDAHDGTKTWRAARSWATAAESFHQQLAAQQVRWYGMTDECTRCPYKSKTRNSLYKCKNMDDTVGWCATFGVRGPEFDLRWHHTLASTFLLSV